MGGWITRGEGRSYFSTPHCTRPSFVSTLVSALLFFASFPTGMFFRDTKRLIAPLGVDSFHHQLQPRSSRILKPRALQLAQYSILRIASMCDRACVIWGFYFKTNILFSFPRTHALTRNRLNWRVWKRATTQRVMKAMTFNGWSRGYTTTKKEKLGNGIICLLT